MLNLTYTKRYDKAIKRAVKRGKDLDKLDLAIEMLLLSIPLPVRYRDHNLKGHYTGSRECHIEPDWLLIYRIDGDDLILEDTGSHSDLFL